jgi:hypothetical protein
MTGSPGSHWAPPGRRALTIAGAAAIGAALLAGVAAQSGGGYDLSFRATSGGGDTSTGGGYALLGSIGQPLADTSTGGGYSVQSGWLPGGKVTFLRFFSFLASDGPSGVD